MRIALKKHPRISPLVFSIAADPQSARAYVKHAAFMTAHCVPVPRIPVQHVISWTRSPRGQNPAPND
jgi:hypothetical protein